MSKVLDEGVLFSHELRTDAVSVRRHDEPGNLYIDLSREGAIIEAGNDDGYASIEIPVSEFGRVKAKLEQIRQYHEVQEE